MNRGGKAIPPLPFLSLPRTLDRLCPYESHRLSPDCLGRGGAHISLLMPSLEVTRHDFPGRPFRETTMLQILNLSVRRGAAVESVDSWRGPCLTSSLLGDRVISSTSEMGQGDRGTRSVSESRKGKLPPSVPLCPWAPSTSGLLLCWLSIGCGLGIGRGLGGLSLRVPTPTAWRLPPRPMS